jgi:D-glycero-alpha-D-manno-heptose-7-phosphate kinase
MGAVVIRAPLRVALGGGGTDLPSYYRKHGGLVVSTAIDKYVHMTVSAQFQRRFRLKHLEWEEVDEPREVRHPILREALAHHWSGGPIELASVGDVPPGTGLGSSGAYAVCAINALERLSGNVLGPAELAEAACHLEIDVLGRSIGKQDQYAAAFGGVRAYTFHPDDSVTVRELRLSDDTRRPADRCVTSSCSSSPARSAPPPTSWVRARSRRPCTGSSSSPRRRSRPSRGATSSRWVS